MININNYFECSEGQFQEVAPAIAKQLLENLDIQLVYDYMDVEENIKYNDKAFVMLYGKRWDLNFVSYSQRWGSLSVYFSDGESLIRISDHWSYGSKVNNCGNIRNCYWTFKKAKSSRSYVVTTQRKRVQVGITRFSEMV